MGPRTHIGRNQFREINWLPVESRVTMARLTMVHKIKYGEVPSFLKRCFTQVSDVHTHYTRASIADVSLPDFKSKVGKGSFTYIGASQWNNLEIRIKLTTNLRSFKQLTKASLLEKVPL